MKFKSVSILVAATLLFLSGCNYDEPKAVLPGEVSFSFKNKSGDGFASGRTTEQGTPAFVSYTIKKADGSMVSSKVELLEFNGDFVTFPQQLSIGHYTLEQFLILDAGNHTIYAAPIEGSPLADLVEHPLPLSFDIAADETTEVIPEVLALEDHSPADFGYVKFGFAVVDKFDFDVTVTIADTDPHPSIDYSLEIIAKDAPLGNVQWSKTVAMNSLGEIHIPAKYAHYTFRAVKQGYISHVQHFLRQHLQESQQLSFEFLPESLDGFVKREAENGLIKFYYSKDRCKFYARLDMPEGYQAAYVWVDRSASSPHGYPLDGGMRASECLGNPYPGDPIELCGNNVNLFDNTPFALAQDHCVLVDLSLSESVDSMDDVVFSSYSALSSIKPGSTSDTFFEFHCTWHEGNVNVGY